MRQEAFFGLWDARDGNPPFPLVLGAVVFLTFTPTILLSSPLSSICRSRMAGSRLRKSSRSDEGHGLQSKAHTQSPPPSPQHERRQRVLEPYPVPSSNPASQYTLLEKLGTGSFGVVYKAIHNESKQIVAIKQIGMFTARVDARIC